MPSVSQKEFNDLLVKYTPYIRGRVLRYGSGDDTEDFVSEVMVQLLRLRDRFDPERGSFVTWARWQIGSCMQQIRIKQRKRAPVNCSMPCNEDGEPVVEAVQHPNQESYVELQDVLSAVGKMKPRFANVLLQRAFGVTHGELANEQGVSPQRIEQMQQKGQRDLRKKLHRPARWQTALGATS